ncbi:hypothetical protein E2C01_042779 [Portunus trituberculatus]|uniref:Uncharacterized protein n=1 Tax=Portunus trituberculatus TaxID=210409 RepID=A0A5B7FR47_PORTR|nr:hypothetical protein [Portunus trituberculatus]
MKAQRLPPVDLMASCSFPYFLMFPWTITDSFKCIFGKEHHCESYSNKIFEYIVQLSNVKFIEAGYTSYD